MSWPDVVFGAPLLRGLDERGRAEVAAAGALLDLGAGESVYHAGEPADAFFVVASGSAVVRGTRRGEEAPRIVRRAERGDCFGEEAALLGCGERSLEARADGPARVARVPLVVFERAARRAGGQALLDRLDRAMRRAGARDLLATASFARLMPASALEPLLDALEHRRLARGEALYRVGDPARDLWFVVDGMLQIQSEDEEGRVSVEAYVSCGDALGDEALSGAAARPVSAVALGPTWVVGVSADAARRVLGAHAGVLERVRRVSTDGAALQRDLAKRAGTTAHVLADLYRLRAARSLLVIDQDACVRCGHCATSCASAHADGTSRLVRHGDRLVATLGERERVTLLVPASCQHCKNPACMLDCPTGAIGRDARGDVFVREDLCTGCGSCAKGCPWDNIQMAPRPGADPKAQGPGKSAEIAVKCDLCKGATGGPACVSECPTQAIARIDPDREIAELGELADRAGARSAADVRPPATRALPWVAGAALGAVALARVPASRWTSGVAILVVTAVLVGYAARKRLPVRAVGRLGRVRLHAVAHMALGALAAGLAVGHGGLGGATPAASALRLAFFGSAATGLLAGALYALVPGRLTRLEKRGLLPEEIGDHARALEEKVFSLLTGRSELVKTIFKKNLAPYHASRLGALGLLASGRTLSEEQARLRGRVDAMLGGRGQGKLGGLDELVRAVVERRGLRAGAPRRAALALALPLHVAVTLAALVLLAVHVALVWGHR